MSYEFNFSAEITHSEETINSFTKAQFNLYGSKQRRIMLISSAALLALAVLAPLSQAISALLIFGACLLFVDLGHIPKRTASSMLKQMQGFDSFRYRFADKIVVIDSVNSGASGSLAYSKITRLAEDFSYFYFFTDAATGYMLSKNSLCPSSPESFKAMLSAATGCSWSSAKGLMGVNLPSIIKAFKNK